MRVHFARSARRHKVGRDRVRQVLAEPTVLRVVHHNDQETKYLILGADDTGRPLEIIALHISAEDVFLVIHVMDLREKYRKDFERGRGVR